MASRHLHAILLVVLTFFVTPSLGGAFSRAYIFGDSLSDAGNLAALSDFIWLNEPPYDGGFSNGPRAVEVLADAMDLELEPSLHLSGSLAVGTNYAVAGARARTDGLLDLTTQLGAFLGAHGGTAPSDALYVLFIGANDVRDARDVPGWRLAQRIVRDAAHAVEDAVQTLVLLGAQAVLVVNAPDIGSIPETLLLAEETGDHKLPRRASKLTKTFNSALKAALNRTEKQLGVDLVLFDLFEFSHTVVHDHRALGFENTTDGCFSSVAFTFHPDCEGGDNIDAFVYFDEVHPAGRSHERIGRGLFALVPEEPQALD